jgi:hypothetical protein
MVGFKSLTCLPNKLARTRDTAVNALAQDAGVEVIAVHGHHLYDPDLVVKANKGKPTTTLGQWKKAGPYVMATLISPGRWYVRQCPPTFAHACETAFARQARVCYDGTGLQSR